VYSLLKLETFVTTQTFNFLKKMVDKNKLLGFTGESFFFCKSKESDEKWEIFCQPFEKKIIHLVLKLA